MARQAPSSENLRRGISIFYHEIGSLFTWYVWWVDVSPRIKDDKDIGESSTCFLMQRNAAALASLMAIRKLTEFFKARPEKDEKDDDLRAYDFDGFTQLGEVLHRDDLPELHKRIAHMTYREIQFGQASYEVKIAVTDLVVPRCLCFLDYLESTFFATDDLAKEEVRKARRGVVGMVEKWRLLGAFLEEKPG